MVALANKVTSDYDRTTNFSKYRTFMWIQPPEVKEAFMSSRIMESVNGHLTVRGLRQVCEGADLAVGSHLATEERHTWETYYTGGDGWGWGWGGGAGWATTTEVTYEVGTLTVDIFDTCSRKLVWQGVATDELASKPTKQTREFDKQVAKMFKYFPAISIPLSEQVNATQQSR
jgi:hypothetical protein